MNVALNYFSYLGGSQNEAGLAITVDSGAGAVITGWTQSSDFPVFPLGTSSLTGFQDAFTARLNTTAVLGQTTAGSWVNYFGGSSADSNTVFTEGTGVALDVNQNAYFAGDTNSVDLQVNKPLQATNNGGYDAFVTQLGSALSLSITGVLTSGTNQFYVDAGHPGNVHLYGDEQRSRSSQQHHSSGQSEPGRDAGAAHPRFCERQFGNLRNSARPLAA